MAPTSSMAVVLITCSPTGSASTVSGVALARTSHSLLRRDPLRSPSGSTHPRKILQIGSHVDAVLVGRDYSADGVLAFGFRRRQVGDLRDRIGVLVLVQHQQQLGAQALAGGLGDDQAHLASAALHQGAHGIDAEALDEALHQVLVEQAVALLVEFQQGPGGGDAILVDALGGHGVIGVHDAHDATAQGDGVPRQPPRVARAVVALVVGVYDVEHARGDVGTGALQDVDAIVDVALDDVVFLIGEATVLVEYLRGEP